MSKARKVPQQQTPQQYFAKVEEGMKAQLDQHGSWAVLEDGAMKVEDTRVLRFHIIRCASILFLPRRMVMQKKRLEAFENKDQPAYVKLFREMHQENIKAIKFMTAKAAQHIGLSNDALTKSMSKLVRLAAQTKVTLQMIDAQGRAASRRVDFTKFFPETVIKALKKKIELDFKMHAKVEDMAKKMTIEQVQEVKAIEAAKVSDQLELEFGMSTEVLTDCARYFKVMQNPEIKAEALKHGRQAAITKAKKIFEENKPSQAILDACAAEVKDLGEPVYNDDGTMDFDYFLKIQTIILRMTHEICNETKMQKITDRRRALKVKNVPLYKQLCGELKVHKKNTKTHLTEAAYDSVKVPAEVLKKSLTQYFSDEEKRKIYDEQVKPSVIKATHKDLSRDETLAAVKTYHDSRLVTLKLALMMIKQRKGSKIVYLECQMAATKAEDELYNTTGVEIKDMKYNVTRMNLAENEDYMKIKADFKEKQAAIFKDLPPQVKKVTVMLLNRVYKKKGVKVINNEAAAGGASSEAAGADGDDVEPVEIDHEADNEPSTENVTEAGEEAPVPEDAAEEVKEEEVKK